MRRKYAKHRIPVVTMTNCFHIENIALVKSPPYEPFRVFQLSSSGQVRQIKARPPPPNRLGLLLLSVSASSPHQASASSSHQAASASSSHQASSASSSHQASAASSSHQASGPSQASGCSASTHQASAHQASAPQVCNSKHSHSFPPRFKVN